MLYGICSDIHSNATAFKAVLESMRDNGVERKVCLGDIVGYGVDTDECVDLVRENMDFCLIGNHDSVAVKYETSSGFNPYAKQAVEWTQKHLSKESVAYIRSLPYIYEENDICFVHASPLSPADWVYVTDLEDALNAFDHFSGRYCFVGHTHSPVIIASRPLAIPKILDEYEYVIANTERLLVNVGSVGQPRDRDPRACWCLLDTETKCVRLIRVEYDVRETQNRMKKAGMPSFLIDRLSVGR
jgi:diadenosine tetraphosphatase ApaH/serine/threonine PP2A family protein phosphatase